MATYPPEFPDLRRLQCFVVAAEELNLRRAAERLFVSQPPLSRTLARLEKQLGMPLFLRSNKGLLLTEEGAEVLRSVRPLLELYDATMARLGRMAASARKGLCVGLSTAFDQSVFSALETALQAACDGGVLFVRRTSPKLVRAVKKGDVQAALVALPLETRGLAVLPLGYAEPFIAAVPESWPEADCVPLSLKALQGRPVFWFRSEANPAFFAFAKAVFAQARFSPLFKDEPAEHDVLLARIAAGEAAGLLPASFAVVRRRGVSYRPLSEGGLLRQEMGLLVVEGQESLRTVLDIARRSLAIGASPDIADTENSRRKTRIM